MAVKICSHQCSTPKSKEYEALLKEARKKANELGGHLVFSCDPVTARIEMCEQSGVSDYDERLLREPLSFFNQWLEAQEVGFVEVNSPGCEFCPGSGEAWILLWGAHASWRERLEKIKQLPPDMLWVKTPGVHLGMSMSNTRRLAIQIHGRAPQ